MTEAPPGLLQALLRTVRTAPMAIVVPLLVGLAAWRDGQHLLRAEFWAEDGVLWYAQAYAQGAAALFNAGAGYLSLLPRLVALASLPFPLAWAPTLFNLCAFICMLGVPLFLLSSRLDDLWPERGSRVLFALLFALMPATQEIAGNLTNAQWYLAPLAFLVLASTPPAGIGARAFDAVVLLLAGLSGPFGIFLLPYAGFRAWRHRQRPHRARAALVALTALAQLVCLYTAGQGRAVGPLGASSPLLAKMVALIPLQAELGLGGTMRVAASALWQSEGAVLLLGIATLAVFMRAYARGPQALRAYLVFSALTFAAALYKPLVDLHAEQWPLMANQPPAGGRYFALPMLAWWAALLVLCADSRRWLRACARALLILSLVWAVPADWPAWSSDGADEFRRQAAAFEAAPAATRAEFAIRPAGWRMVLIRK